EIAAQDKDLDLRITALRIARSLKLDVIPLVTKLARDPSPQVRRECALALYRNPSPEVPKLWTILAQQYDGKDRWYLEALGIGAATQEERCFADWLAAAGSTWNN